MDQTLFVLGGARSGKSRYAQARAEAMPGQLIFIATAEALDEDMANRIERHRADRDARWRTIEAPLDIAEAIAGEARPGQIVLVDCLTLWASNLIFADRDIGTETQKLTDAIARAAGPVILVANEVGLGIVPDNLLARQFRDAAGIINQAVAVVANEAVFLTAGLPLKLK
jgi:adenosylcobinamide kinase / adenosylcobinamide-phosphate guanylyltransferase